MKIDPRHLQQLATIIEAGTFNEAAARLKTTQPALSRMISTLEMRIGAPLFERSRRPLAPTEIGRKLAMHGRTINETTLRASHLIDFSVRGEHGSIKVGAPPFLCDHLSMQVISNFLQKRSEVRFQLIANYFADLQEKILLHQIDLAICPMMTIDKSQSELLVEPLFESEHLVVCRTGHPLAAKKHITIQDLEAATWIGHSEKSYLSVEMQSILSRAGVTNIRLAFLSESAAAVLSMLSGTDYLTILPNYAVYDRLRNGSLTTLPVPVMPAKRMVGIMMHAQYLPSPVLQVFVAYLRHATNEQFGFASKPPGQ